jgi:Arylmalonate decarboxylase
VRAFADPPLVDEAAELLAAAPLHAIVYGFTSSSYVRGAADDAALKSRLEARTRGIPVTIPRAAAVAALTVLGAKRLARISYRLRPNIRSRRGLLSKVKSAKRAAQIFVGDQMTHGGQKGFGMTKHGRSGHATRSPRFRFLQKLEAQKNDRKDRSRIKDPKQSVAELFHPRKPT